MEARIGNTAPLAIEDEGSVGFGKLPRCYVILLDPQLEDRFQELHNAAATRLRMSSHKRRYDRPRWLLGPPPGNQGLSIRSGNLTNIRRTIIQGFLPTADSGRQRPRAEDDAYPILPSSSSLFVNLLLRPS